MTRPAGSPASPGAPAAEPWRVRLLGDASASRGDRRVHNFGSRSAAVLLARLALQPQRSHAREELIELLWPGVGLETGRNRLRQTVFMLRQALAGAALLQSDRISLRVVPGAVLCDAVQFEALLQAGRADEACAVYGGELMPGFYEPWVDEERLRLAARFERAQEIAARGFAAAAPARRLPLPGYLTRFFAREGEAERLRQALLSHRLLTLLGPGGCGKTRLAVETAQRLRPADLRSPGGQTVDEIAGFDTVAFVPLASCSSEPQLLAALAAALQLQQDSDGDPFNALATALAERRVLLVLDNFEQLCGVGEVLVARLLDRLPGLHLLVTSRRVLGVDGEREWLIEPLPLPSAAMAPDEALASPALALFIDRARAVGAEVATAPGSLAALVELVRRLDGIPLALELAAARTRSLSPQRLVALLSESHGAGSPWLELLQRQGPRSGADARHASMLAVIDWSWRLLGPAEQRLLAALTVFQGSFTHAAAQGLGATASRAQFSLGLDELVAHSLLRVSRPAQGGEPRFAIGEPVREYATRTLSAEAAAQGRAHHRRWMIAWAQQDLKGFETLSEIRAEMPNLLSALASALADGAPADAIRLALPLARAFEDVAPPPQALTLLERAAEACTDDMLRSQARSLLAPLLFNAGQKTKALQLAEAGLAGAPPGSAWRGRALHACARVRWRSSRSADGLAPLIDEALRLAQAQADLDLQASLLALQAFIANVGRDVTRGEALHGQALALWERIGHPQQINSGRYNLAVSEQAAGRHAQALARLDALIGGARALQDWRRLGQSLNVRGLALAAQRRWAEAAASYRECIVLGWDCMSPHELAYALWNLPRALAHSRQPGDAERAVQLGAFIARYWPEHFGPLGRGDRHDLRRLRRLARCQLDAARLGALWAAGERLSLAAAVQLAH